MTIAVITVLLVALVVWVRLLHSFVFMIFYPKFRVQNPRP